MHLSFVSTTPGRAGIPGGFDNKFVPERRANKCNPRVGQLTNARRTTKPEVKVYKTAY
jgi:hypothetical protein